MMISKAARSGDYSKVSPVPVLTRGFRAESNVHDFERDVG